MTIFMATVNYVVNINKLAIESSYLPGNVIVYLSAVNNGFPPFA